MMKEIFIVSYIYSIEKDRVIKGDERLENPIDTVVKDTSKNKTESRTVVIIHNNTANDYMKLHNDICLQLKNKINQNYMNDGSEINLSLIAVNSIHKEEIYG